MTTRPRRRFSPLGVVTTVACSLLAALPGRAAGQAIEDYAARSVSRIAHLDLRARPLPEPDDFLIAEQLLATAMVFAPDDEELVRARIRAAWAAGDTDGVSKLTRRLVELDPRDTVAQLRLISSRLREMQTVEERAAAYDRLLGPAGGSLDAAVRSRLALDAAMLARERNQEARFVELLTTAMELDPSHKEAASLAWTYFSPFIVSRVDRIELLLNLLYSDPVDPNIHQLLAIELASAGAFIEAERFQRIALNLMRGSGATVSEGTMTAGLVIGWQIDGPEVVVNALNRQLMLRRQEASQRIAVYQAQSLPTEALPRPETVMLDPLSNQIRLVAAIMAGDDETIESAIVDMTRELAAMIESAREADQLSGEAERQQRAVQLWTQVAAAQSTFGWAGARPELIRSWTEQAAAIFTPDSPILADMNAWNELRNGDPQVALGLFEGLSQLTPLQTVGRALALETAGRRDEAVALLYEMATTRPLALSGVWARGRHAELTGVDPMLSPEQMRVSQIATAVPAWIDRMTQDPTTFMTFSVRVLEERIAATGRAQLRVRLRNHSPIPLAVGGDRALNSRVLLSPRLESGITPLFGRVRPEVMELDRRLRLLPTEAIDVTITPDLGMAGWLAEVGGLQTQSIRWRAIQGYGVSADGIPVPGALCLDVDTDSLIRTPLLHRDLGAEDLASLLEEAPASELAEVAATCRARILAGADDPLALSADEIERVASVAAERYEHLPVAQRAILLATLPTPRAAPEMSAFESAARRESDPRLLPLVLVTTVVSAEDVMLTEIIEGEDPELTQFARALRDRLQSQLPTYSRFDRATLGVDGR